MKNCLESKIKGSIDYNDLPVFMELVIKSNPVETPAALNRYLELEASEEVTVTFNGGGYYSLSFAGLDTDRFTTLVLPANTTKGIYISNGDYEISFSNKYAMKKIRNGANLSNDTSIKVNCSALSYLTELVDLKLTKAIFGSIDDTARLDALSTLLIDRSGEVTGNISSLGEFISIESLTIAGSENIVGSLESLASGMVANGRESGTLTFISNTKVTYNGVVIGGGISKTITFGQSYTDGYDVS